MAFSINSIKNGNRKNQKIIIILIFGFALINSTILIKKRFMKLNKYIKRRNPDHLKVCLCVICKEENLYLKEFVEAYRKLGFNHIFIYDNNDINSEKIEEVIMEDVNKGFVTIINYRGFRGPDRGPQMYAYYDCYNRTNLIYDWIAFFDVDEYLRLNKVNRIQNYLIDSRYDYCEMVKINWRVFTDNNQLDYENKSLTQRFTEESKKYLEVNTIYKIIIRGNLSNYSLRKLYNPHDMFTSNQTCDSNGNIRLKDHIKPPVYKYARINHYKKTIGEFCRKLKKGDVYYNKILEEGFLNYNFQEFFHYNKKTKEKVSIFNREFNTSFK